MAIMRYEPVGLGQLQQQINRLFSGWDDTESSAATAGWVPTVDINEFDDRFQLFVDLPGVDPDKVDITLDNGVLTISGERTAPEENNGMVQRRVERGAGHFHRRFILPDTVDADKVAASNRHGVLEISIPKQARALPRRIKVAA
ncbi:MAG TPA: Hsp20/alpha crystallin family protein [Steroidobacteraceae bacterium]|nr:Hsp20/alpha crystallin family protein [Steroidobacteraceae bacterium]HRX88879.1 Hsp20/alpha crystallin family protein [Steroidobacteraceae bacterium]